MPVTKTSKEEEAVPESTATTDQGATSPTSAAAPKKKVVVKTKTKKSSAGVNGTKKRSQKTASVLPGGTTKKPPSTKRKTSTITPSANASVVGTSDDEESASTTQPPDESPGDDNATTAGAAEIVKVKIEMVDGDEEEGCHNESATSGRTFGNHPAKRSRHDFLQTPSRQPVGLGSLFPSEPTPGAPNMPKINNFKPTQDSTRSSPLNGTGSNAHKLLGRTIPAGAQQVSSDSPVLDPNLLSAKKALYEGHMRAAILAAIDAFNSTVDVVMEGGVSVSLYLGKNSFNWITDDQPNRISMDMCQALHSVTKTTEQLHQMYKVRRFGQKLDPTRVKQLVANNCSVWLD